MIMPDEVSSNECNTDLDELIPNVATNDPIKIATLVYNGERPIKINRDKVASSCWYFEQLLKGNFKEANQNSIDIEFGDMYSFDAFMCMMSFASGGKLHRDPDKHDMHLEAIQMAIFLGYDEFVNVVQDHIIETHLGHRELDALTTLAKENMPQLSKLKEACDRYADRLLGSREAKKPIPLCAIAGHKNHKYGNCKVPREGDLMEDNWEMRITNFISEEEKIKLADAREEQNIKGRKHRFKAVQ